MSIDLFDTFIRCGQYASRIKRNPNDAQAVASLASEWDALNALKNAGFQTTMSLCSAAIKTPGGERRKLPYESLNERLKTPSSVQVL